MSMLRQRFCTCICMCGVGEESGGRFRRCLFICTSPSAILPLPCLLLVSMQGMQAIIIIPPPIIYIPTSMIDRQAAYVRV